MRKKFISLSAVISIVLGLLTAPALAEQSAAQIIGAVYTTDIGAVIDGNPIKSYNISDSTYIKAEDLRGYGFSVEWNADARTLAITPDSLAVRTILPKSKINIKKADIPIYRKLYDVYSTDIKTYLNGNELSACNIDGETLVKFSDLSPVGYVEYDDEKRLASLDVIKHRLDLEYEAAKKQEITLADGITYIGEVSDGIPNGIGKRYNKTQLLEFPGTINDETVTAHFIGGEIDGEYYTDRTYQYTIGSDLGTYTDRTLGNTKVNYDVRLTDYHADGYALTISNVSGMPVYFENGVCFGGIADNSYLYCVRSENIDSPDDRYGYTTYTNGDRNIEPMELPEFDHFTGKYSDVLAVSSDGKLYTLPYSEYYRASTAVLYGTEDYDKTIISANVDDDSYSDDDYILTADGKLYGFAWNNDSQAKRSVLVAENAAMAASPNFYLAADGVLYDYYRADGAFRAVDTEVKMIDDDSAYVTYIKNDGSLWTYRSSNRGEGSAWNDGFDYSAPVKRADDVKCADGDGYVYLYVKNDGSLWGFGLSSYGQFGYIDKPTDEHDYAEILSRDHVKIGDNFVSCKTINGICFALSADGDLYAWGSNDKGLIIKDGEENILSPVKIAEDVKDYDYSGAVYIIKNDGSLYYRGRTYFNRFHDIEESIEDFTQCTRVYRITD